MKRSNDELAQRHLLLAAAALRRADRGAARFHVRAASIAAGLDDLGTGHRDYDVDVVWRTADRTELRRTLVRIRASGAQLAHDLARQEVALAHDLGEHTVVMSSIVT